MRSGGKWDMGSETRPRQTNKKNYLPLGLLPEAKGMPPKHKVENKTQAIVVLKRPLNNSSWVRMKTAGREECRGRRVTVKM
jgi:hypothetical protein